MTHPPPNLLQEEFGVGASSPGMQKQFALVHDPLVISQGLSTLGLLLTLWPDHLAIPCSGATVPSCLPRILLTP